MDKKNDRWRRKNIKQKMKETPFDRAEKARKEYLSKSDKSNVVETPLDKAMEEYLSSSLSKTKRELYYIDWDPERKLERAYFSSFSSQNFYSFALSSIPNRDIISFKSKCPVKFKDYLAGEGEFSMRYKNWRNETDIRRVKPISLWFGSTEFHKEEQWFLKAIDLDRSVERDFAIKDAEL